MYVYPCLWRWKIHSSTNACKSIADTETITTVTYIKRNWKITLDGPNVVYTTAQPPEVIGTVKSHVFCALVLHFDNNRPRPLTNRDSLKQIHLFFFYWIIRFTVWLPKIAFTSKSIARRKKVKINKSAGVNHRASICSKSEQNAKLLATSWELNDDTNRQPTKSSIHQIDRHCESAEST